MTTLVVLIPDLMFGVKVVDAARRLGFTPHEVASPDTLLAAAQQGAAAIVIDGQVRGDWQGAIRAIKADPSTASIPILVFVPHVDVETSRAAVAAGVDRIVTRGKFARELPDLLRSLIESSTSTMT